MGDYKDLKVWNVSHALTLNIYKITRNFPNEEKFGLVSQLRRASLSIPTNIAEGCGQLTDHNFIRFLGIARGSAIEVEYLIKVSFDLGYITEEDYKKLTTIIDKVIKMINGLIKSLKSKD